MSKVIFPVPSARTQAVAQVDRERFQDEYSRFWANYCNLAAKPDQKQFDRLVEPLLKNALCIRQPIFAELWLSS
jgi:hypothetical protein